MEWRITATILVKFHASNSYTITMIWGGIPVMESSLVDFKWWWDNTYSSIISLASHHGATRRKSTEFSILKALRMKDWRAFSTIRKISSMVWRLTFQLSLHLYNLKEAIWRCLIKVLISSLAQISRMMWQRLDSSMTRTMLTECKRSLMASTEHYYRSALPKNFIF